MEDETERLVAAGYDAVADAYAGLEGATPWPREEWLGELLARLPGGSRVLDLGCGAGVPAARLLVDRGHAVLGVDVSEEQLRRARANVPEAELLHAGGLDLELAAGSLDAVVALYVVDHVPRERHPLLLSRLSRWLRDGGLLLLAVEAGDEPGVVGDWLGAPMFFSHHDAGTTARLVREAGFELLRAEQRTQREGGRPVPYLWVLARRRAGSQGTC